MQPLTGPLADSLKRQRVALNTKFLAMQTVDQTIDGDTFLNHLATTVDAIVRRVAVEFAEKVDVVTAALYDISLKLWSAGLLGPEARCPVIERSWQQVLVEIPRLLAREPERITCCITNAVYNIAATPGARPDDWLGAMAGIAAHCPTTRALLDCGKLLAWKSGMVQFRPGALATIQQMPPDLAARVFELPPGTTAAAIQSIADCLAENPWIIPKDALQTKMDPKRIRIARTAGAFRGFGGPFLCPPLVTSQDGRILVSDGESSWMLLCDIYGVFFDRIASRPLNSTSVAEQIRLDETGQVRWGEASARFAELVGAHSSIACDGYTLAVTVPTSHKLFLLARG
jgi:hypothetical protein